MITFGLNSHEHNHIVYGNRSDVCELCLREAMAEAHKAYEENRRNKIVSRSVIANEIAGQQAGKPLFRVPTGYSEPTFICKAHMKDLLEKMEEMPESNV